jgi:hypothetical protein
MLLASLPLYKFMMKMGGCGFCVTSSIWKSGSMAMSERIVILMSDLLCLAYVSIIGQSPLQIVYMGMIGCHVL